MNKIQVLPAHLTNMIAAGEVVERPAGIVKELIENSLDAQATTIQINLIEGGIKALEVLDNGTGMSLADCKLAFKRHATSKISQIEDLWQIASLGFRGEALPSVAAVAKVTLISSTGDLAHQLIVANSQIESITPVAANRGTQVKVEQLFYQTPARLKHLKSLPYEVAMATRIVERFALAFPKVAFKLVADERLSLETNGSGDLLSVIQIIYGLNMAQNSVRYEFSDYDYQVHGALLLPKINRANRNDIFIFINQRMVRSYSITQAILAAYEKYLPSQRYPVIVLNITMDERLIDVNVHPAKWEIRLAKEKQLTELIKEKLEQALKTAIQPPKVASLNQPMITKQAELDYAYTPTPFITPELTLPKFEVQETITPPFTNLFLSLNVIGQLGGKYILSEGPAGLYIIDQHAAEERFNFERLSKLVNQEPKLVPLLVPLVLPLTSSQQPLAEIMIKHFQKLNIQAELWEQQLIFRTLPAWLTDSDEQTVLAEIISALENETTMDILKLREHALASAACHSSIRFNRNLSLSEMKQVLVNLSQCEQPYHCPHGRPTIIVIDEETLLKEFYR